MFSGSTFFLNKIEFSTNTIELLKLIEFSTNTIQSLLISANSKKQFQNQLPMEKEPKRLTSPIWRICANALCQLQVWPPAYTQRAKPYQNVRASPHGSTACHVDVRA